MKSYDDMTRKEKKADLREEEARADKYAAEGSTVVAGAIREAIAIRREQLKRGNE